MLNYTLESLLELPRWNVKQWIAQSLGRRSASVNDDRKPWDAEAAANMSSVTKIYTDAARRREEEVEL